CVGWSELQLQHRHANPPGLGMGEQCVGDGSWRLPLYPDHGAVCGWGSAEHCSAFASDEPGHDNYDLSECAGDIRDIDEQCDGEHLRAAGSMSLLRIGPDIDVSAALAEVLAADDMWGAI